jgi:CHAT domain-containing protein/tetratricopeptide (TPR) repeat protein
MTTSLVLKLTAYNTPVLYVLQTRAGHDACMAIRDLDDDMALTRHIGSALETAYGRENAINAIGPNLRICLISTPFGFSEPFGGGKKRILCVGIAARVNQPNPFADAGDVSMQPSSNCDFDRVARDRLVLRNGVSLVELAQRVVDEPERWVELTNSIRARLAALISPDTFRAVSEFSTLLVPAGPHPLGFVTATVIAQLLEDWDVIDEHEPEMKATGFLEQVRSWALWHPLYDERLMPIRIQLTKRMLSQTDPSSDPLKWAVLQQTCGVSYAACSVGSRDENIEEAIQCYQAALASLPESADRKAWATLQNNLGHANAARIAGTHADNIEDAIRRHQSALEVFGAQTNPVEWAETHQHLGSAYAQRVRGIRMENLEKAMGCFEKALTVRTKDTMPERWAESQSSVGAVYVDRIEGDPADNIEQAIAYCEAALGVFSPGNMPTKWALAHNTLGNAFCDRIAGERAENLEKAISCYRTALGIFTEESMPTDWARAQNNLGTAYLDRIRGDRAENVEDAIRCYRAALKIRTNLVIDMSWAVTRHNLASAFMERLRGTRADNVEEAINSYKAALTVRTHKESPVEWAMTHADLGYAYIERIKGGRFENLETAISHLETALLIRTRETMPLQWAQTWNNVGNAYRHRIAGDPTENLDKAVRCYGEAAEAYRSLGIRREAVRCFRNLARAEMKRGSFRDACGSLETAAGILEDELHESHSEIGRLDWLREQAAVYDGLVVGYLQLAQLNPDESKDCVRQAGYWAERGRARYLADLMAATEDVPPTVSRETYDRYRVAIHEVRDLDQQMESLERTRAAFRPDDPRRNWTEKQVRENQSTRQETFQLLTTLRDQLAHSDPNWISYAAPLSIEAMQEVARRVNAALLTLRPTEWGTCAILITPSGGFAGHILSEMTSSRVSELLIRFEGDNPVGGWKFSYDQFRECDEDNEERSEQNWLETIDATLRALGAKLWTPLCNWLSDLYPPSDDPDAPRPLVLLPGMGLNVLPLHAVWRQDGNEQRYACDDYQISYAPSLWILDRCMRRQDEIAEHPNRLLAVRNPTGDLDCANWEVDSICCSVASHFVLGDKESTHPATRLALKRELPRFPVALIASHGKYDARDTWSRTGLCTADGEPTDPRQPFLTLRDLSQLDLSGLWLAVLSACESGLTDERDPAGEQMGLPSALLAAGGITAVGSLWVVDDLATALLSRRFFQELYPEQSEQEVSKGRALWRAQRWLRQLTAEELEALATDLPPSQQAASENRLRTTRDMVRVSKKTDRLPQARPFAHPVWWSAFALSGAT